MASREYSVIIGSQEFHLEVSEKNGILQVKNRETGEVNSIQIDRLDEHLMRGGLGDTSHLFACDRSGDRHTIVLNGHTYNADVVEKRFREREQKRKQKKGTGTYSIEASIPGQVIEINTSEGDKVEEGETLLLLSAMKLENEIQTAKSGTVKSVNVEKGQNVTKGEALVEIEV